jgi:hypothetical protein
MTSDAQEPLDKRAQKAMLQNAFLRWESAVVIAITLLLTVFAPQLPALSFVPAWAWLVGGLAAEGLLVYSSYSDPETGRKVVAEMLQDEFEPQRLSDKKLQAQVEQALDYRGRITTFIRERRDSVLKDSLIETVDDIDEWLANIYTLAKRLDGYRKEKSVLERDKSRAAERIRQLEARVDVETDPDVKKQIAVNSESLRRQISTIEKLDKTMDRANLQLENTLSALGTIYSQTMLAGAKDIDSARAKRLSQDIHDEVQELDNVLVAMDEVYAESSQGWQAG